MKNSTLSQHALIYTAARRRRKKNAQWSDVAAAYDAGLIHALSLATRKRMQLDQYMRALRVMSAFGDHHESQL